jgi:hypothetical protein
MRENITAITIRGVCTLIYVANSGPPRNAPACVLYVLLHD